MISFIVQNETHALNYAPLIQHLLATGVPASQIDVLHLGPIFNLQTEGLIEAPGQRSLKLPIPRPYYFMGGRERLAWLLRAAPALRAAVARTSIAVIGSDGGVQRLLCNAVRARGGRAVLLFDGMLPAWPASYPARAKPLLRRTLNRAAARFGLNPFVPGDIGHSRLDHIFVMHEVLRALMRDQGVRTPVEVVQLPRFDRYREQFAKLRAQQPARPRRCLFVTAAFRWHGSTESERLQLRDLDDLCRFAVAHPDWEVRVRVHPRELREDYLGRSWPDNVSLSFSDRPGVEDLAWASVLVTWVSTMALEAELVGVPAAIYTANLGPPLQHYYYNTNPYFQKISSLESLPLLPDIAPRASESASSVPRIADVIKAGL